jgi:twinkle protein
MPEALEEGKVVSQGPCPDCDSSDAYTIYDDGHTHCFSCGAHHGKGGKPAEAKPRKSTKLLDGAIKAIPPRGLTEKTCEKFGYRIGEYKGQTCHIAPYYRDQEEVAQKIRLENKEFLILGDAKKLPLFGQNIWGEGGKRLILTEGEIDAMSVSQMQHHKWPVVSVPNGAAGASRSIKDNLTWVESFETVVFMFDNDDPGKKAALECARLLSPGKACIATLPLKDANDMLMAGRESEVLAAQWNAKAYRPDGIVTGDSLWEVINRPVEQGYEYPWTSLTESTYGVRPSELIVIGAGTGVGKSTVLKAMAVHMVMSEKIKVGMLLLEESNRDTALSMMGMVAGKLFHTPTSTATPEEREKAYKTLLDNKKVYLYDSFGQTEWEIVKERIRYMVVACGVKVIFLDHLTMLTDGLDEDANINQKVKVLVNELTSMTRELKFTCIAVSHLRKSQGKPHEEGGRVHLDDLYGSSAIKQYASFVFGLERNQQADDKDKRNTTIIRVLKDRYTGRSIGNTVALLYDTETGRLNEVSHGEEF